MKAKNKVLIVDSGTGNLTSLKAALERLNCSVERLTKPNNTKYSAIVLPGQGRFGQVMTQLVKHQWIPYLTEAKNNDIPILGICVGMQVMFEGSDEDPNVPGLAWFKGRVEKILFPKSPMIGWAALASRKYNNACVYFVNSFAVKNSMNSTATTSYGETICAAVQKNNVIGVQFHPEKSSTVGSFILADALGLSS